MEFITKPETIILAVSSANMDLANSDSLKIAREVDPEGHRTLGVITKIDLMDKGTNALDMLNGTLYKLKLGYVGVVCRSQHDINMKKPIDRQFADEKNFFRTHPAYAAISDRLGVPYLANRLNTLLIKHIKETLPSFKENLARMLKSCREELSTYGEGLDGDYHKMSGLILDIIEQFATGFKENIEGSTTSLMESSLGARIKDILFKQFKENIAAINMFENFGDELISTAIKNTLGIRSSLFIPEQAFEMLTKKLILKLHDPSINCLFQVLEELKKSLQLIRIKEFEIYPNLANEVILIIDRMLNNLAKPAQDMIESLIKVESVYINIEHPDFIGGNKVMVEDIEKENVSSENLGFFIDKDRQYTNFHEPVTVPGPEDPLKETEKKNVAIIKKLIESYFDIVKKNIRDAVPKCIMTFLVYKGKSGVHTELVSNLYKESKIYELLAEPEDVQEKRKKCKELLRALERANSIINEIRNIS
jgi:replication fork clamp-binding protein CrfC